MALTKQNFNGYVVKITESAFIDMCLSALEAYCVQHKRKQKGALETYGLVWGHEASMQNGKTLYTVQKVSIDTSAKRTSDSTTPKSESLYLKCGFIASYFPDMEFLGDFHTHPYTAEEATSKDVRKEKFYEFSVEDVERFNTNGDFKDFGYRVGLVMAIAYVKRKSQNIGRLAKWCNDASAAEFRFSNYRIWLQAYVTCINSQNKIELADNDDVMLEVPGILGLNGPYTPFVHYKPAEEA